MLGLPPDLIARLRSALAEAGFHDLSSPSCGDEPTKVEMEHSSFGGARDRDAYARSGSFETVKIHDDDAPEEEEEAGIAMHSSALPAAVNNWYFLLYIYICLVTFFVPVVVCDPKTTTVHCRSDFLLLSHVWSFGEVLLESCAILAIRVCLTSFRTPLSTLFTSGAMHVLRYASNLQ